jgi:eukaryotic-like serine/threonine-protein kinase
MFLSDAAVARLRAAAATPEPGPDRYAIVEPIGQGGMGTVYLATDTMLGRDVAIKVPNVSSSEELERRLQVEARVLASLEHPGIVPIHDAGRLADGRVFYVMKRVHGRTLQAYLADRPAMAERLRVFERICEPVAFAHARGFIHRDLKPENIMVGAFGEVMVMDWGVAKLLAAGAEAPPDTADPADPGATRPGTIAGTPGFMAPEQSDGGAAGIDERADVYGLGALLCFLLTGDAPPPAAMLPRSSLNAETSRNRSAPCARAPWQSNRLIVIPVSRPWPPTSPATGPTNPSKRIAKP